MINNSREERLSRIRAGLPVVDGKRGGARAMSAIRVGGSYNNHRGGGFEISDKAAHLIAQAVKTLLHS